MASTDEIIEAYGEWQSRSNANDRLRKMLRGWDRVVIIETTDTNERLTITVVDQTLTDIVVGAPEMVDLVVTGTSEDFCDMFWGDLNPSEKYISGEIVIHGAQADVMRLDAMSMVAFLDQ